MYSESFSLPSLCWWLCVGDSLNLSSSKDTRSAGIDCLLAANSHLNVHGWSSRCGIMLQAVKQMHDGFDGLMRPFTPHWIIACDLHHKRLLNFHFSKWISLNENLTESQTGEVKVSCTFFFSLHIFHPWWQLNPYYYIYKPCINTHQKALFSRPHNPWIIFIYTMSRTKLEGRFANEHIYISSISETRRRYGSEIGCLFEMPVGT